MKYFLRAKTILLPLVAVLCLLSASAQPVSGSAAEDGGGKELFRAGKQAFEEGRYDDAVKSFSRALTEFPLLADYALSYLAEAYHQLGNHCKSLDAARRLLKEYPNSPLFKKTRGMEIREAKENSEKDLPRLYEVYVKDYPGDEAMAFEYGLFLKDHNEAEEAAAVFKKLYIGGGDLSGSAGEELPPGVIKPEDIAERAENLIERCEYGQAEQELRKVLAAEDVKDRQGILRILGYSLFMQKEYAKAAKIYGSVGDTFFEARSFYRAGDEKGFDGSVKKLLAVNDKRAGFLLLAAASDERREKDFDGALKTYQIVLKRFPAESEGALWGIGWTHFVQGEYKKAGGIFSKLYAEFGDPKYLYWKARSIEAAGGDSKGLFNSLAGIDNNFYGVLAVARNDLKDVVPVSLKEEPVPGLSDMGDRFRRVEALISLNMNKEAVTELTDDLKGIETFPQLLYIMEKLEKLGEFKRSIRLASRIPYSQAIHRFLYPLAFREDVEEAAKKYDLDPMILLSVMREESRFDADARSVVGARGLMQIMPGTAYRLDKSLGLGIRKDTQIADARNNIILGACYLKSLFGEFKSFAHVLAAYNAGENLVRRWEAAGHYKSVDVFIEDIPYPETRNYVKKVITSYFEYKRFSAEASGKKPPDITWGNL
jgi:soluble lytic murein transglycosylase